MSIEQQDEQIVQEIVGQVMDAIHDDGNIDDHNNSSSTKLNDENIGHEVSHLNAYDVSTGYTDSEEANNKKDESSLHSPKEEKQPMNISVSEGKNEEVSALTINGFVDSSGMTNGIGEEPSLPFNSDKLVKAKKEESPQPSPKEEYGKQKDISILEGNNEVPAMTTNKNIGEESHLTFNSTSGQNGGDSLQALEVSNLIDLSTTDEESMKAEILPPTPKEEYEKQQKDISMLEGKDEFPPMVSESGEESDVAFNSMTAGQNDQDDSNNTITNNDMDSDTTVNGGLSSLVGPQEDKVEQKQQPQKTNKTKLCSVL